MKIYCQNVYNNNPTFGRNPLIAELVSEFDADICLFQEFGPFSTRVGEKPLHNLLSCKYTEACDLEAAHNYTPVFYKSGKYKEIDSGYFCYTGLNDVNSKSVTWAVLEEISTAKRIAVAATHFWWEYSGERDNLQRLENVKELKACFDEIIAKYNVPVIVGGDFNNGQNADQGDEPYHRMLELGFTDIRLSARESTDCFTHRDCPDLDEKGVVLGGELPYRTLDYIFTYGPNQPKALAFDVLTSEKALASSDHCPLVGFF